ncbi:hypothetical protein BDN71DRAFT_1591590 [Pleurotus eryngii]|uniref:CxC2-like cysteine cluster KDZ transposase-associated domain-containing protein n=1 Tax=Pleurotus eryngii TaxID=5323 RepID=A0A9P5ZTM7_PLEER|nr:hypothetical protein BDN71DRAFT_1591590 [Pleurotus eryngii]
MPLISCDPDDPNGGRFSVVGCNGRCEVLVDRHGRPNLVYTANDSDQTAQVEELMSRMTLNQNIITVVVSDSEDDDEGAPQTPKRKCTTVSVQSPGLTRPPTSPTGPRTPARNALLSFPSPRETPAAPVNTPALLTPDLSPTKLSTSISSPSSLGTLSPLVFAAPVSPAAPIRPMVPVQPTAPAVVCHPTAPPFTGNGIFHPSDYTVPARWALRYAAPWSPVPKCGRKWYVVRVGFEVGVFWDTWDRVQPLVCFPGEPKGYDSTTTHSYTAALSSQVGKRKSSNIRISYPDTVTAAPITSFRIHRTASNRLGGRTYVQRIVEAPTTEASTSSVEQTNSQATDEPTDNPWSDTFFANNASVSEPSISTDDVSTSGPTVRPPNYLDDYLRYRQGIVDSLLEIDGRLGSRVCHKCAAEEGVYRCESCLYPELYCAKCVVKRHVRSPFHRLLAAFTLDVLETFHLLTLQSKVAAYDFYRTLEHKTDNAGVKDLPDYYERFLDVIRVYRNLMAAKRSGRAHDPAGVKATATGECTVECPACPHPGKNLPEGWETATDCGWLYSLILTMDANFRLKNRDRYVRNDTSLSDGWGHWVPSAPFLKHIEAHNQDLEPNLCDSQWRAINQADTKRSSGYASTGVGGVVCGRHGLVRCNGFGDLQKGERYANMDFILFQTLAGVAFQRLLLSYDIVCQYSQNLFTRMKGLPEHLQLANDAAERVDFVIPKFHLFGHGTSCQLRYSINLLPGCAHSDLEDPERWWAHINPVSMSTKLMTPWARRETIDDHARGWNWRKITQLTHSVRGEQTTNQAADLQEQRNVLLQRIVAWRETQHRHMPMVAADLLPDAQFSNDKPEVIPLFLPSEIPGPLTSTSSLRLKETRLRIGQANDALIELCRLLRITMGMWEFKFTDVSFSQRGNTRARSTINRFQEKPLHQSDIKCLQRRDEVPAPGESCQEISWIWLSISTGSEGAERPLENIQPVSAADITNCLKAEWARSRARAARWGEEKALILEEMRRVLAFLDAWAAWWDRQQRRCADNTSPTLLDGLVAYATKQASILRCLRRRFVELWRPLLDSYGLDADWFSNVELPQPEQDRAPAVLVAPAAIVDGDVD